MRVVRQKRNGENGCAPRTPRHRPPSDREEDQNRRRELRLDADRRRGSDREQLDSSVLRKIGLLDLGLRLDDVQHLVLQNHPDQHLALALLAVFDAELGDVLETRDDVADLARSERLDLARPFLQPAASLFLEQLAFVVKGRGEREIHVGPVPAPEEPAGFR